MGLLELLLVLALIGAVFGVGPWWGYSRGWGYSPIGFVILVLLVILILRHV